MSGPEPRSLRNMRIEQLKTEHLLGIEGPFGGLNIPAFGLFALPREIRDLVYYQLLVEPDHPEGKRLYNLATFKDPPITLVSKRASSSRSPTDSLCRVPLADHNRD